MYTTKSNVVEKKCPRCDKNLRYKGACCNDKNTYLVCPCGYKEIHTAAPKGK